jgi:hypothetical protein
VKKLALLIILLLGIKGFSQEEDLFQLWHLTQITVEGIDYFPSNYGFFPKIEIQEDPAEIFTFTMAEPHSDFCITYLENLESNPNTFTLDQNSWTQNPNNSCTDFPDGPCVTIYGKHADIYYDMIQPFTYSIEQNGDEFTLEIANPEGNRAYYSSVPLSQPEFSPLQVTLYPNPVGDVIQIQSAETLSQVLVYDISGKVVKEMDTNSQNIEIQVNHLPSGIYFIKLESLYGSIRTEKFIKK